MKILYLITKSEIGGAQTHVMQLSQYFINKGNEVEIMAYPDGWLEDEIKKAGGKFYSNPYFSNGTNPFRILKAMALIKKAVSEFEPEVVHCHSSAAGFLTRVAIRNKVLTIFTAHGWGFNIGVPSIQKVFAILAEKIASIYCKKIICVSNFVRDLGLKYKIASIDKFTVIYNGVELSPEKVEEVSDGLKIVFVGRLADPKEPLVLLKAYNDLPENLKQKSGVIIIGDGPKRKELEDYIKINNLSGVKLLGSLGRDATLKILTQANIFVLISKWEGLPITILEAMSAGLPVIASDVGGIKEALDINSGILIKNNGVLELKAALEKLLLNNELRDRMSVNSRLKAKETFSLEKMLAKTEEVYRALLNKR